MSGILHSHYDLGSLHPNLTHGPAPKPVCIGCRATGEHLVLAPVHGTKTMHICLTCAGLTLLDVQAEIARRSVSAVYEALAPAVPS